MTLEKLNPRESLGFLSWKVARLITNALSAKFAEEGIDVTVEQWRALVSVCKKDGLTQGRLCEVLSQEKTGVSRLVAALEKRGLVRREASEHDRRVKYLYSTEAGRQLVDATAQFAWDSHQSKVQHIDPDELAICKKVLWQIIEPSLCCGCPDEGDKC